MISPDQFERTYDLTFPNRSIADTLSERTQTLVGGKLLQPRKYHVEVKYVNSRDIYEQLGRSLGSNPEEFYQNCLGYSLEVFALYNLIIHRPNQIRNLLLNVLFDKRDQSAKIPPTLNPTIWIRAGFHNYDFSYVAASPGIACLVSAEELSHDFLYSSNLWSTKRTLTDKQTSKLASNLGLPEQMNWVNTFRRFATQTEPDANGNFTNGQLLTAEHVFRRLVLPPI